MGSGHSVGLEHPEGSGNSEESRQYVVTKHYMGTGEGARNLQGEEVTVERVANLAVQPGKWGTESSAVQRRRQSAFKCHYCVVTFLSRRELERHVLVKHCN